MHGCTQLGHAITGLPMQIDLTEARRPPAWLICMHKKWQGWPELRNPWSLLGTGRPGFNRTLNNKPGVI